MSGRRSRTTSCRTTRSRPRGAGLAAAGVAYGEATGTAGWVGAREDARDRRGDERHGADGRDPPTEHRHPRGARGPNEYGFRHRSLLTSEESVAWRCKTLASPSPGRVLSER